MSELENLKARQQELSDKIHALEEQYEGIENKHNAQKLQELNKVQVQLMGSQNNLKQQLQSVQEKLKTINDEIDKLSSTATDRIFEAIKSIAPDIFEHDILCEHITSLASMIEK